MKLGKLASKEFSTAFKKLLQEKLPIKTSLKLRKMSSDLQREVDAYHAEYMKLIKQYGDQVKSDGTEVETQYTIPAEKKDIFLKKFDELFNTEYIFTDEMKIGVDELGSEQLSLTVEDLILLEFIG